MGSSALFEANLDAHKEVIEMSLQRDVWQGLEESCHMQGRVGADRLQQKSVTEMPTDHRRRECGLRLDMNCQETNLLLKPTQEQGNKA